MQPLAVLTSLTFPDAISALRPVHRDRAAIADRHPDHGNAGRADIAPRGTGRLPGWGRSAGSGHKPQNHDRTP